MVQTNFREVDSNSSTLPIGNARILRDGPDDNTLFVIHSVTGGTGCYAPLANEVRASCRIVAINAPGLDVRQPEFSSLADLGVAALRAIRSMQPAGPYALCGYSLGGSVAHEVARLLLERSEQVRMLTVVDTFLVTAVHPRPQDRVLWLTFSSVVGCSRLNRMRSFDEFWDLPEDERLTLLFQEAKATDSPQLAAWTFGMFSDYFEYFSTLWSAQPDQELVPLELPAQYLHTAESLRRGFAQRWERTLGCKGQLLSGNHISIVYPPHVAQWAAHIDSALGRL